MDTHYASQIFHPVFWVDPLGNHPHAYTQITLEDVRQEKWTINPAIANSLSHVAGNQSYDLTKYVTYYVQKLALEGKYPLTIWPYHSMLGGIGHSLVSSVEEALFFHNLARHSQTRFEIKGNNPLTENYSVLSPEVLDDGSGGVIAEKNQALIDYLLDFDRVLIAGQAKSHCVAWTVCDLLAAIQARDSAIAKKVYLLEDCTSPVVISGVIDFSEQANTSFAQFAAAGMHRVQSTTIIDYLS
jgi:nicotinamidase-related amidase